MEQEKIGTNLAEAVQGISDTTVDMRMLLESAGENPYVVSPLLEKAQEVRQIAHKLATELALEAVERNALTRRAAAELLGVHPITISRWLTAAAVEAPEESDRNYPPVTS